MKLNCIWWWSSNSGKCGVLLHCHYFQFPTYVTNKSIKNHLYSMGLNARKQKTISSEITQNTWIWKYSECDSTTSRYKITPEGLICHYNWSNIYISSLSFASKFCFFLNFLFLSLSSIVQNFPFHSFSWLLI